MAFSIQSLANFRVKLLNWNAGSLLFTRKLLFSSEIAGWKIGVVY